MPFSRLDKIYRSVLLSRYFIKGWGSPENLKKLLLFRKIISNRDECIKLIGEHYPIEITKDRVIGDIQLVEGCFYSPFDLYLPSLLPRESKQAYFQMILPKSWRNEDFKPVCLHMAGTGDHFFWRRRHLMGRPLLREAGIGSIILENPFYGYRKPVHQERSVLNCVSDIFVMGGCLILEALVLFNWCKKQGLGPLGITGISMGGHMASLAASNWPEPIVLVPCLSWSTASGVFTEGVMSKALDWKMLENQFKENYAFHSEINKMVQFRRDSVFHAGREFAKKFPDSMSTFRHLRERTYNLPNSLLKMGQTNDEETYIMKYPFLGRRRNRDNFLDEYFKTVAAKIKSAKLLSFRDMATLIKTVDKFIPTSKSDKMYWREYEAIHFMKGIMDECTHLKNFSIPVDTSLIISVCAAHDAYVPNIGSDISEIWPGAEIRYVDGGHVLAFALHQQQFRNAIIEAFERYKKKYIPPELT